MIAVEMNLPPIGEPAIEAEKQDAPYPEMHR